MANHKQTLKDAQTIAIVGCSDKPHRTSNKIAGYLQEMGYHIIPVNPNVDEVHGEPGVAELSEIPDDEHIDIVNIFRNPAHTGEMVQMAVERHEQTGEEFTIWTQPGVSSGQAKHRAKKAGLPYVEDRCIMVEHGRHIGTPEEA